VGFVVTFFFAIQAGSDPARGTPITVFDAIWAFAFIGFPTAGALIASKVPRSPLGWLLCVAPLLLMFGVFAGDKSHVIENSGGSVSSATALGWLSQITFELGLGLLCFVPLFVPDGKLPSRRWRPLAVCMGIVVVLGSLNAMFTPGQMSDSNLENPLGVPALKGALNAADSLSGSGLIILLLLSVVSIGFRFRRSRGVARQQLKWLAFGAGVIVLFLVIIPISEALGLGEGPLSTVLFLPVLLALPVTLGIAMLKHRLYDIDVVLNRTLVYGTLTAVLGAAYLGTVVLLQQLLDPITAQSDISIAASTLAVAALFRPVRTRIQTFIDRRFYRRKYDAASTLETFATRLRDRVELDSLSQDLVAVVSSTMQPAHASLWLRASK
jgi:hypothetical protein